MKNQIGSIRRGGADRQQSAQQPMSVVSNHCRNKLVEAPNDSLELLQIQPIASQLVA
jgi:hypothetical protein